VGCVEVFLVVIQPGKCNYPDPGDYCSRGNLRPGTDLEMAAKLNAAYCLIHEISQQLVLADGYLHPVEVSFKASELGVYSCVCCAISRLT
jgi:hypothetical protein